MAVSMRDLDSAFQGAGQKAGIEIWRIENFRPVPIPKSSHGKFFSGDSYVILKTSALKSGALRHDIHYWLGKDTSQDEAGAAAIKTVELDAALGGRAVQYREVQGHETEKFLSYFKPCIIPQEGGVSSGFKHAEAEEHKTRMWVCQGKHVVRVKEVPFARSSLNHDDIFILDTKSKIFQFNGSNSSIQERAKALEVVQYIKDTYHDGKCEIAAVEDGKLMADAETGEFWGFLVALLPFQGKVAMMRVEKGQPEPIEAVGFTRELLDTHKCYILDCGVEFFIWMGRNTSLGERKTASEAADELLRQLDRPKCHLVRVIEGYEPVMFKSKFESWPQSTAVAVSEDARGKVAALLKRQGFNVKGLLKATPLKEEPQPYIDCTGNLQVWRVNGQEKNLLQSADQSKFYSGDCYIFQYSYPVDNNEECLVGTWFGKQSVEEDRASATAQASKLVESLKFLATQARIHEGHEPIQFFAIFQSFIVFKGGLSEGYKRSVEEKGMADDTYSEDGLALFRIQGTGPENMQAIQVEPVASSLNCSYCYILHSGSSIFTWFGSLTTAEDQELVERLLDVIKPNAQSKVQKEGVEYEQFWELLNGKSEYPSQKIGKEAESDPHLFSCNYVNGNLQVMEIYNFSQDDLMTEDTFILDCQSDIHVWVGQQVQPKSTTQALAIGEKFWNWIFFWKSCLFKLQYLLSSKGASHLFFTRFFNWDTAKSGMRGNSFERKLAILKGGGTPTMDKPKRRSSAVYGGGRSSPAPEKTQRSRSVSFSPERVRVRGRSPAFNALAANFENPNARNLSTPPPIVRKIYPKSVTPISTNPSLKSGEIAALGASFDKPAPARGTLIPRSVKENSGAPNSNLERENSNGNKSQSPKLKPDTIEEDVKESAPEDEDGLPTYPYERLKTSATDPVTDIDVTKRETYLSSGEFKEKFGMSKGAFYKLPKWKQNKLKMALQLF